MKKIFILTVSILLILAVQAQATDYYVRATAQGDDDCTVGDECTLDDAEALIVTAGTGGHTIHFLAGTYTDKITPSGNASSGNRIVYQAKDGENDYDSGTADSATETLLTDTSKGWTIDALIDTYSLQYTSGDASGNIRQILDNTATTITTEPFLPAPSDGDTYDIIIHNVVITNSSSDCAYLGPGDDYITFDGLFFSDCSSSWINVDESDYTIIQHCKFYESHDGNGIQVGDNSAYLAGSDYTQILNNIFLDAPLRDTCGTGLQIWNATCQGNFDNDEAISDNSCNCYTSPSDTVRIDRGLGTIIEHNEIGRSDHNAINITPYHGGIDSLSVIRNNILKNDYHTNIAINSKSLLEKNIIKDSGLNSDKNPQKNDRNKNAGSIYARAPDVIVRYNISMDNDRGFSIGCKNTPTAYSLNNWIYNNVFYNNSWQMSITGSVNLGATLDCNTTSFDYNTISNNIFFDDVNLVPHSNQEMSVDAFTMVYNRAEPSGALSENYYNGNLLTNGADTLYFKNSVSNARTLAYLTTTYPEEWGLLNTSGDPNFTDVATDNFNIGSGSAVDSGIYLAYVKSVAGSNLTLYTNSDCVAVGDPVAGCTAAGAGLTDKPAMAFYDADGTVWGIVSEIGNEDTICGDDGEKTVIVNIGADDIIEVASVTGFATGDGITVGKNGVCFVGSAPDIGAYEYSGATASGTVVVAGGIREAEIVAGGKTIVIDLEDATWDATIGADNALTTALIAGIDSDGSEATGWDAVVKANMVHGDIVRTDADTVTITLAAESTYSIVAGETITITIPASCTTHSEAIIGLPTFTVIVDFDGVSYNANAPSAGYHVNAPSAGVRDDYSDIKFFWRAEAADFSSTNGTLDYSAGDDIATLSGALIRSDAAKLGTNGLDSLAAWYRAEFTSEIDSIADKDEGRIGFWYRTITYGANATLFTIRAVDTNNEIVGLMNASDELYLKYVYAGTTVNVQTTTSPLTGTPTDWMFVEFAWKVSDDYLGIFVDGVEAISSTASSISALTGTFSLFRLGESSGNSVDQHLDHVIISDDSKRNLYLLSTVPTYENLF